MDVDDDDDDVRGFFGCRTLLIRPHQLYAGMLNAHEIILEGQARGRGTECGPRPDRQHDIMLSIRNKPEKIHNERGRDWKTDVVLECRYKNGAVPPPGVVTRVASYASLFSSCAWTPKISRSSRRWEQYIRLTKYSF